MIGPARFSRLDRTFEGAMSPWRVGRSPLGLLFSGGVDSGLLAWELREQPGFVLVTVGAPGSPDLRAAEEAASLIGAPWQPFEIDASEVRAVELRVASELEGLPPTSRSVLLSLAVALDRAPGGPTLCGQGADELFLGYAHFRGLSVANAARRAEADLRELLRRDWPRSCEIAKRLGRTLVAPYLDPAFVTSAEEVPVEERMPFPVPKAFFREWATHRGLPASIAHRPKRALQFGSGIERLARQPVVPPP